MKTLVIHPYDKSTLFLCRIYSDLGCTVIDKEYSDAYMKNAIERHERIILLGHGSPSGLFIHLRTFIDSQFVYLLRQKQLVGIWCNADKFAEKYNLSGFFTGMFISDYEEAISEGVKATAEEIKYSNDFFAGIAGKYINCEPAEMLQNIQQEYNLPDNVVIEFNRNRLYNFSKIITL